MPIDRPYAHFAPQTPTPHPQQRVRSRAKGCEVVDIQMRLTTRLTAVEAPCPSMMRARPLPSPTTYQPS
jgi:hypothetical protein